MHRIRSAKKITRKICKGRMKGNANKKKGKRKTVNDGRNELVNNQNPRNVSFSHGEKRALIGACVPLFICANLYFVGNHE